MAREMILELIVTIEVEHGYREDVDRLVLGQFIKHNHFDCKMVMNHNAAAYVSTEVWPGTNRATEE